MSTPNRLDTRFRKTEVFDLTSLNQLLDCPRNILDRHIWINPVLIEEINSLNLQALKRALNGLLNMLRTAIQASQRPLPCTIKLKSELGSDDHLLAERCKRF